MSPIALPMQELKPALTGFGKVLHRHQPLPVLNHIKVERTKDGWIALTATDLDVFATVRLEQPVEGEPVALLVPLDDLQKVAKSCGKTDIINIAGDEKSISLQYPVGTGSMETKVDSLPVDEFPSIPQIKGDSIPLPDALRSSLHEALDCASTDQTRLILNGAFIDVSDRKGHYIVGTNGSHLYASNSFSLALKDSIIIPTHRFLGFKEFNNDGEWQLKLGEKPDKDTPPYVQLTSRRWRFITKQHDGNYPNWRQVVVSEFSSTVTLDVETLDAVIKTIERLPEHDAVNHTLGFEIKGKQVNLLCKADKEAKWTPVELKDVKTTGKDTTVYLNRIYVMKALSFGLNQLDITDPRSPVRFSHEKRQMIVMPIRVDADSPASPAPPTPVAKAEPPQPAAPPQAAQEERKPTIMPRQPTPAASNGNGNGNGHQAEKPALEIAVEQVEAVKASIKSAVGGLNDLLDTLKQVQREQKTTDKEVQSVRSTLEKLQSVKL
ncbi:MAG: DNA polymerase III subunit beta [Chthoniobacteraceae bacterium]